MEQDAAEQERQPDHSVPARSKSAAQHRDIEVSAMEEGESSINPTLRSIHTSTRQTVSEAVLRQPHTSKRSSIDVRVDAQGPQASMETENPTTVQSSVSERQLLIRALQDSARLRRELAKADEVIARYYERLIEKESTAPKHTKKQ